MEMTAKTKGIKILIQNEEIRVLRLGLVCTIKLFIAVINSVP